VAASFLQVCLLSWFLICVEKPASQTTNSYNQAKQPSQTTKPNNKVKRRGRSNDVLRGFAKRHYVF